MNYNNLIGSMKTVAWIYLILSIMAGVFILSMFRELVMENVFGISIGFGVMLQGMAIWGLFSGLAAVVNLLQDIRDEQYD